MTRKTKASLTIAVLAASCVASAALWLAGCNYVTPAAYILGGPPKTPALHQLADVPTLVYIDDRESKVSPSSLRRVIADRASETIMVQKLVATTISPQDAMSLTGQLERNSQLLAIDEIGRKVGAKQVIFVEMVEFDDQQDRVPRPHALCYVRVIDVDHHIRTFPPPDLQERHYVLQVKMREADPDMYASRTGRTQIREKLAVETGEQIARIFYDHEPRDLGSSLVPK